MAHRVQSSQQRLWPDAQPLVERLGRDFFRELPEKPGVYLMRGATEIVLYVGKAKNLRHRLGSYRVANPERMARRTLRLLNLVNHIGWEECESETAALRRESELLLALKPRFNRAGVWQGPKRFLCWRVVPTGLELSVADAPMQGWTCTGPFGAQAIHLHRALVRMLWNRLHTESGLAGMPAGWWRGQHGPNVVLQHADAGLVSGLEASLTAMASGDVNWLTTQPPVRAAYEVELREEDLELVGKHLFGRGLAERGGNLPTATRQTPELPRWY